MDQPKKPTTISPTTPADIERALGYEPGDLDERNIGEAAEPFRLPALLRDLDVSLVSTCPYCDESFDSTSGVDGSGQPCKHPTKLSP